MFGRLLDRIAARFPRFGRFREWAAVRKKRIVAAAVVLMHLLGAASSVNAVMSTRTSQGAIAWVVSLNTFPWVAVPAYWVFGQSKFDGYEMLRRQQLQAGSEMEDRALRVLRERGMLVEPENERYRSRVLLLQNLSQMPLTRYNDVDLLIDGEETFDAIIDAIGRAEDYVLVQFYILRSDGLGHRLKDALLERAARGVRVHVLYDALGSHGLGESYLAELQQAGVIARPFVATRSATRFVPRFILRLVLLRFGLLVAGLAGLVRGRLLGLVATLGAEPHTDIDTAVRRSLEGLGLLPEQTAEPVSPSISSRTEACTYTA